MRCLVYVDMNMVRAGVVDHPSKWIHGGYREIQAPPLRYRLIDRERLIELCGMQNNQQLVNQHHEWIEQAMQDVGLKRQEKWSEAVCVGSKDFVEQLKHQLGVEVLGRNITQDSDAYTLREPDVAYNAHFDTEKALLNMDNGVCFDENKAESTG